MHNLSNENVVHIHEGRLNYLQFRRLNAYPEVAHCFTLKPMSFPGEVTGDSRSDWTRLAQTLGVSDEGVCKPRQTHTDHIEAVAEADKGIHPQRLDNVDGLLTDERGISLFLTFADCTPLLFYDPVRQVIADTHSGWRGTHQRIGYKTVQKMIDTYGCDPDDIICCIGPHIRQCCFEVDRDVRDLFAEEFADMADMGRWISQDAVRHKYYIDTASINHKLMQMVGLREENIIDSGICTVCNGDICHSFRTDKANAGRAAAVIALR